MFLGAVLLFRLGKLLYCVSATEGYFYVCVFEEIGYFPNFRAVISEGAHFLFSSLVVIVSVFCCICAFSLVMSCGGNLLLLALV